MTSDEFADALSGVVRVRIENEEFRKMGAREVENHCLRKLKAKGVSMVNQNGRLRPVSGSIGFRTLPERKVHEVAWYPPDAAIDSASHWMGTPNTPGAYRSGDPRKW